MVELWTPEAPWIHVLEETAELPLSHAVPPTGVTVVARLDGGRMTDDYGIFEQFSQALKFPVYFGWDWDALNDCLRDLGWREADRYLILIENGDLLLSGNPEGRRLLLHILARAAKGWANPMGRKSGQGVPFNVVIVCSAAASEYADYVRRDANA